MKFAAWSYSRLHDYDTCPRKAKLKHLDKITEPPNKSMARGAAIHRMAEAYVKGELKALPEELAQFEQEFKDLRKRKAATEDRWAFDKDWRTLDDFFHKDTVARLVVDALAVKLKPARGNKSKVQAEATVIDYKTGQRYGSNAEQIQLYAMGTFAKFPDVDTVVVQLWYLDLGEMDEETFTREKHYPTMREYWEKRPKKLMSDTAFKPTPGGHCTRCYYSKSKHKDCEF